MENIEIFILFEHYFKLYKILFHNHSAIIPKSYVFSL